MAEVDTKPPTLIEFGPALLRRVEEYALAKFCPALTCFLAVQLLIWAETSGIDGILREHICSMFHNPSEDSMFGRNDGANLGLKCQLMSPYHILHQLHCPFRPPIGGRLACRASLRNSRQWHLAISSAARALHGFLHQSNNGGLLVISVNELGEPGLLDEVHKTVGGISIQAFHVHSAGKDSAGWIKLSY